MSLSPSPSRSPVKVRMERNANPTRRYVVKDVEVENFKSYAGRHTIGPFHKTFTAVIGPNGSGKSNVIDSMLFVFGKSAKKIRLEKFAELIHSSAAFPNLSSARVQVNFAEIHEPTGAKGADPDQREEIPGTGFSVAREVYRSGNTQFFLNGKKTTQKEVIAFLVGKGVDLEHNRFLILQGEVEQIALMKPKGEKEGEEGLLEYLDDLIGTNKYLERINEATIAAEKYQEERLAGLDSLKKVAQERDALQKARDDAVSYVRKDNQLQRMTSIMCQLRVLEGQKDIEEPRKRVATYDEKITLVKEKKQSQLQHGEELKEKVVTAKKKVLKAQKELDKATHEREECDLRLEEVKAEIDEADKTRKKEAERLKKLKDEIKKTQALFDDAIRDKKIAEGNVSEATAAIARLEPEYDRHTDDLQATLKPLRKKLAAKKQEMAPWEGKVTEAEQRLEDAKLELANAERAITAKKAEKEKLQTELEAKLGELDNAKRRCDECNAKLQELEKAEGGVAELEQLLQERTRTKYQVNQEIEQLKKECREVEADDKISSFLRGQRDLQGYHGTLRQLGTIDMKYDVAAGVAGGNFWGFHVVDDDEVGRTCINLLKQSNMGRASFIALSRVRANLEHQMDSKFKAPANSTRLFDLIKSTHSKFCVAFYHAVRNTLVVDGMTRAREVGLGEQRHRVVTLNGELVEVSGVVTGGGREKPRGANLQAKSAPADKIKVKQQFQELQAKLVKVHEEERTIAAKLQAAGKAGRDRQQVAEQQRKMASALAASEGVVGVLRERLARCQKEEKEFAKNGGMKDACDKALNNVEAADRDYHKAVAARAKYKDQVEAIEQEMEAVGGDSYKQLKADLEREKQRLTNFEKKVTEARKSYSKLNATLERKSADAAEVEARLAQVDDGPSPEIKAKKGRVEEELQALQDAERRKKTAVTEAADEVSEAEDGIVAVQENVRKYDARIDDLEKEREEHAADLAERLAKLEKYEKRIAESDRKITENVLEYGTETIDDVDDDEEAGRPKKKRTSKGKATEVGPTQEADYKYSTMLTDDELKRYDFQHSRYLAQEMAEELKKLRESIDFAAIQRWKEKNDAWKQQKAVYDDLHHKATDAERTVDELRETRKNEFMDSFNVIHYKLKQMYQMLTNGGDADIELVDDEDPYEGVNFVVRPPRKSWKTVTNLSGGEKTLSSLALVFALHHVKPTPFYVLDEIDAALDFRNVSVVAKYVLEHAVGAQFIIISLRNNMFELAHQLVGICKVRDCTRSVPLNPKKVAMQIRAMVGGGNGGRPSGRAAVVQPRPVIQNQDPTVTHRRSSGSSASAARLSGLSDGTAGGAVRDDRKRHRGEDEDGTTSSRGPSMEARTDTKLSGPKKQQVKAVAVEEEEDEEDVVAAHLRSKGKTGRRKQKA